MLNVYEAAFNRAFSKAIQSLGVDALKRTSMFGSTHKKKEEFSLADAGVEEQLAQAA